MADSQAPHRLSGAQRRGITKQREAQRAVQADAALVMMASCMGRRELKQLSAADQAAIVAALARAAQKGSGGALPSAGRGAPGAGRSDAPPASGEGGRSVESQAAGAPPRVGGSNVSAPPGLSLPRQRIQPPPLPHAPPADEAALLAELAALRVANAALTRQVDMEREERLCCVCMDGARCMAMAPCGHVATCAACYVRLPEPKSCVTCQAVVESAQRVYM